MSEKAFTDPTDDDVQAWLSEYGMTGVKRYELETGPNAGAVAWYRETSVTERLQAARLDVVTEAAPDAYDTQRMLVKACLLWPALDDYPMPALAALEIYGRVRQHGHGPLPEDPELDGDEGATLPESMVRDMRASREAAQLLVTDPRYGSVYFNLCVRLASRGGSPDPRLLYWLMSQPVGVLRDLSSLVELAHGTLLESGLQGLSTEKPVEGEERPQFVARLKAEQARMRALFYSPFDVFDEATSGATMPFADDVVEADEEAVAEAAAKLPPGDEDLLPDAPVTAGAMRRIFD